MILHLFDQKTVESIREKLQYQLTLTEDQIPREEK